MTPAPFRPLACAIGFWIIGGFLATFGLHGVLHCFDSRSQQPSSARRPGLYFERTIAALTALLVVALVVWVCVEMLEEFGL